MNYGVDESKRVTRKCECGARYTTKASAPIGACDACMTKLREAFWAIWDRNNGR